MRKLKFFTLVAALLFAMSAHAANSCRYPFVGVELSELLRLSNTSNLGDVDDAQVRIAQIEKILRDRQDQRAIFPVIYEKLITAALPNFSQNVFADQVWARRLLVELVRRYLNNLNAHLSGRDDLLTLSWRQYYQLTANCDRSVGRKATSGMLAHLMIDFPESIYAIGSRPQNYDDFNKYGALLIKAVPQVESDMRLTYGYDIAPFYHLYFIGDWMDTPNDPYKSTALMFQTVRINAWKDGMALRSIFIPKWITRASMQSAWKGSGEVLDVMEKVGKL